jgi:L-threonylcarbamoyladenylate synthase
MLSLPVSPIRRDPHALEEALRVLRTGGIIAFPTDTFYALTCDPTRRDALEKLYRLKRRPAAMRVPFVAADSEQAGGLVSLENPVSRLLAQRFWPGPLSLILPLSRPDRLAPWDWGETLAIRVPGAALARDLARKAGVPIPATSANISGAPAASHPAALLPDLVAGIDLLLDGGPLEGKAPSTLLDLTQSPPRILRRGAIPRSLLEALPGLAGLREDGP